MIVKYLELMGIGNVDVIVFYDMYRIGKNKFEEIFAHVYPIIGSEGRIIIIDRLENVVELLKAKIGGDSIKFIAF